MVFEIILVIKEIFEEIFLEIVFDVIDYGIVLIGGGVLLKNFFEVIVDEIKVLVFIVNELFDCVVVGIGELFKSIDVMKK